MSAPSKKTTQRVFISYARSDHDRARELAERLRSAEFEPFLYTEAVAPGSNWALEIGQALKSSDAIVVLFSKDFLSSPSAAKEWEFALASKKHEGRVLPVLMPGTAEASVPWIFEHLKHVKSGSNWTQTTRQVVTALRGLSGAA